METRREKSFKRIGRGKADRRKPRLTENRFEGRSKHKLARSDEALIKPALHHGLETELHVLLPGRTV